MKPLALIATVFLFASGTHASDRNVINGVPRVVDGDTIDIAGERVRLKGIDTPERAQRCQGATGLPYLCGQTATKALENLIGGRSVLCEVESRRDRYGRAIGACHTPDGVDVAEWLVRNGLGLAYRKYSKRYVTSEETARSARRGMHAGSFVAPWDWRRGIR